MDDADKAQEIEAAKVMEPYAEETESLTEHYTVFLGVFRTETGWEDILIEEEHCL